MANDYVEQRERLFPMAEDEADRRVRKRLIRSEKRTHPRHGQQYDHDYWSEYFHRAMDRMWEKVAGGRKA